MKHTKRADSPSRERTRRAILEALGDVILDTHGLGFSVQTVADKAGVTHRTVYNHFPNRDALCEAFSGYVDEELGEVGQPLEPMLADGTLLDAAERLYRLLPLREREVRAGVMLMIANRRPTKIWQERTKAIEATVAGGPHGGTMSTRQVAAALRLFMSSVGWHLLTEHCGLSDDEATATSVWASRALLDAAAPAGTPTTSPSAKGKTRAKSSRRR